MFESSNRYMTSGINQRLPKELQALLWIAIDARLLLEKEKVDYLQVFTFKKVDDHSLAIHHEQEQPPLLNIHYTDYKEEYEEFLNEKVFVIDDITHSTMLFAYEY